MANSVGEDKICVERDVERWFKSIHVHKEMRKEKKRKKKGIYTGQNKLPKGENFDRSKVILRCSICQW